MIKVAVAGYAGRMGSAVVDAVTAADDMTVVCGIDPHAKEAPFPVFGTLAEALDATDVDVLVDFTQPNVVAGNLSVALPRGVDCVVGTTGLSNEGWPPRRRRGRACSTRRTSPLAPCS